MIRFGIIRRMISSILGRIKSIGGSTETRVICPKGLYSRPQNEVALVFNLSNGNNQDVAMALQKEIELQAGDVIVTDDKSFMHFQFKHGGIVLKTEKLLFAVTEFEVEADEINFNGCTISNDGVPIDKTHTHPQNAGDHFGGGVSTSPPNRGG